ncbi:hypothetical protein ACFLZ8_06295 [Planctomycetota bacterium]
MVTYAIMCSANGFNGRSYADDKTVYYKNKMDVPFPSERMVFIDEGQATPNDFAMRYDSESWWDTPPIRHSEGSTFSFLDGHSEFHKWIAADTVALGLGTGGNSTPQNEEAAEDLYYIQKGIWGKLGFNPSF